MNYYLNYKKFFNQNCIYSYLQLLKKVKEFKLENTEDKILNIKLPEPNFTRVLQGVKMANICNIYTDTWTGFDEIIDDVHVRIECTTARINNEMLLRRYKGENAI